MIENTKGCKFLLALNILEPLIQFYYFKSYKFSEEGGDLASERSTKHCLTSAAEGLCRQAVSRNTRQAMTVAWVCDLQATFTISKQDFMIFE